MAEDQVTDPLARAYAHLARREFAEAEAAARREIQLEPYSAQAYVILTEALIGQGKSEAARAAAERAIALEPDRPTGHVALASAWLAAERPDQAEQPARRAVSLDPGSPDAHMVLGRALQLRGATDEANREFDQAIVLEPPTAESERVWSRWRAPVIAAVGLAAFLAFHALRLLRPRFTDWRVAVLLLALTFVLVIAVLLGLAVQRRRLARLSPTERLELAVEARRRRAQDRGQYVLHLLTLTLVIGGLAAVTLLFAVGQKASLQVAVGDCFSLDRMVSIEQISTIPCLLPHDVEVYAVLTEASPPGTPYPGSPVVHQRLRALCEQLYEGYVGVPFSMSAPTAINTFAPEESYWRLNIRTEFCALRDWRERQLVGSRRG